MIYQQHFHVDSRGRGSYLITPEVQKIARESGVTTGLCHVFVQHTSASLMICENADPDVRSDLERFMARLVPDGDPLYRHDAEGPDDMSAHVRSVLTHPGLILPVSQGRCDLGTWQGVYLWEHRTHPQRRRLCVTIHGD
jgi:secondary thiamine-phosphate synthase enzyme